MIHLNHLEKILNQCSNITDKITMNIKSLIILFGLTLTLSCGITDTVNQVDKEIARVMKDIDHMILSFRAELTVFTQTNKDAQLALEKIDKLDQVFKDVKEFKETTKEQLDQIIKDINDNMGKFSDLGDLKEDWDKLKEMVLGARDKIVVLIFFQYHTENAHIVLTSNNPDEEVIIYGPLTNPPKLEELSLKNYALLINQPNPNDLYHFCELTNINQTCFKNINVNEDGTFDFELIPNRKSEKCEDSPCIDTPETITLQFKVNSDQSFTVYGYKEPTFLLKTSPAP